MEIEKEIPMEHRNDNLSSPSESDIALSADTSLDDCAVCTTKSPQSGKVLHSVTIVGGETQIGNKWINTTHSDKVTVIVSDISSERFSSEAQIIRDIQRNLEHESASAITTETYVNILYVLLTVGTVMSGLVLYMYISLSSASSVPPVPSNIAKFDNSSYCDGLCIVNRVEWGWLPSFGKACKYVVANNTRVILLPQICKNKEQCSEILKKSQDRITINGTKSYYPLKYNFVIGGDERIYVGKAWDCGWENFFQIAILFNNYYYTVSERQTYLTLLIINIGHQCGYITSDSYLKLQCGYNCAQNMDLSRALNLITRHLYYVDSYEHFMNESIQLSESVCKDFSFNCIKVDFNSTSRLYGKVWVKCEMK